MRERAIFEASRSPNAYKYSETKNKSYEKSVKKRLDDLSVAGVDDDEIEELIPFTPTIMNRECGQVLVLNFDDDCQMKVEKQLCELSKKSHSQLSQRLKEQDVMVHAVKGFDDIDWFIGNNEE